MKKIVFYSSILLISTALNCIKNTDDCHKEYTVVNNSDHDIYYKVSLRYPDTTLIYDLNPTVDPTLYRIYKFNNKAQFDRDCYEGWFFAVDTIMCFIFDAQTIERTPWDTIMTNYLILKRYDLSINDMQNTNWTITYP